VDVESPLGARYDAKKAGGESQPEERHGLAAAVHMIVYMVRRVSIIMFVPNIFEDSDSIHAFDQPLPLSVPNHRHECLMRCAKGYRDGTDLVNKGTPMAVKPIGGGYARADSANISAMKHVLETHGDGPGDKRKSSATADAPAGNRL
jgi:hypothetical protein